MVFGCFLIVFSGFWWFLFVFGGCFLVVFAWFLVDFGGFSFVCLMFFVRFFNDNAQAADIFFAPLPRVLGSLAK